MYWTGYFDGYPPIDWTHVNSLTVSSQAVSSVAHEVLDLSLKPWDQIVRYDTVGSAILWSLNGQDNASYGEDLASSIPTTATDFENQHDVTVDTAGNILLFDNTGDGPSSARVMQLQWDSGFTTATITRVWPITTPVSGGSNQCSAQGSAEFVPPGTASSQSVVAMCPDQKLVQQLRKTMSGGTTVSASLYLDPDTSSCTSTCFCGSATGTPASVKGWTRAFQVSKIGVF